MPNKTIYVSQKDIPLFEEAQQLAGEALSTVISRALKEYVIRNKAKDKGMKEVGVKVGAKKTERELRFVGTRVGEKWKGFSDDKEWWLEATIYRTQKDNWAVHLVTVCKAYLVTNDKSRMNKDDYLVDFRRADLFVAEKPEEFAGKLPEQLIGVIRDLADREEQSVEYLDI